MNRPGSSRQAPLGRSAWTWRFSRSTWADDRSARPSETVHVMAEATRVAGVILAAGRSRRMGTNKLLLPLKDEPLVRSVVRTAEASGLDPIVVVVGHEADQVLTALRDLPCRVVENRDYDRGMRSSLGVGLRNVPPICDGAVVFLADMPLVTPAMVRELLNVFAGRSDAALVASRYGEVVAPPLLVASRAFADVAELGGEGRGGDVVRRLGERAVVVDWPQDRLVDVDNLDDYARLPGSSG